MRGLFLAGLVLSGPASAAKFSTPSAEELRRVQDQTGLQPRMPAWLPPGYALDSLGSLPYHGKNIIHGRFTDGKNSVSLFQLPPRTHLDFGMRGREKFRRGRVRGVAGQSEQGRVLGWSVKGARLVLVGRLSLEELGRIAESVP